MEQCAEGRVQHFGYPNRIIISMKQYCSEPYHILYTMLHSDLYTLMPRGDDKTLPNGSKLLQHSPISMQLRYRWTHTSQHRVIRLQIFGMRALFQHPLFVYRSSMLKTALVLENIYNSLHDACPVEDNKDRDHPPPGSQHGLHSENHRKSWNCCHLHLLASQCSKSYGTSLVMLNDQSSCWRSWNSHIQKCQVQQDLRVRKGLHKSVQANATLVGKDWQVQESQNEAWKSFSAVECGQQFANLPLRFTLPLSTPESANIVRKSYMDLQKPLTCTNAGNRFIKASNNENMMSSLCENAIQFVRLPESTLKRELVDEIPKNRFYRCERAVASDQNGCFPRRCVAAVHQGFWATQSVLDNLHTCSCSFF